MSHLARRPHTLARRASEGSRAAMVAAAFMALTAIGCFGDGKINVSGSVSANGQPVDHGTIRFAPTDGHGPTDGGPIEAGKYSAHLMPGDKKVHIEAYKKIGEEKQNPADPSSPVLPVYEPIINTDVTAEVTAGRKDLDFHLESP